MAMYIGNGGGSIVFGIADKVTGRANVIICIRLDMDTAVLPKRIYKLIRI